MPSALKQLASRVRDLLLPPLCLACDAPTGEGAALCPECWGRMRFIATPMCACCGEPFETPMGDGFLCGACVQEKPNFAQARAALLYDDASRPLLIGFKHSDRTYLTPALAAWMQRAGQVFWEKADVIIPVPLHPWRLFKRRYNQSAMLALELGGRTKKKVLVDALIRRRATPTQGHLKRKDRAANVKDAFCINPAAAARVAGKIVVLVDDVMTTGATVNECSRILLQAGASKILVLTAAKVRGFN